MELAHSLAGWQEDPFTGGRWAKKSLGHKVRVQWFPFTGSVLAEGNALMGTIYQVFERCGENISYKDNRIGWLLLRVIDALQDENKQLRATGN